MRDEDIVEFFAVNLVNYIRALPRRLYEYVRELPRKLLSLHDSPHAIAGGVAIGIFIGFMPFFGVKTLVCIGLAYLFRCNPIAAVIAVSLHDVIIPLAPVFFYLEYDIGYWLLSHPHVLPPQVSMKHAHFHFSDLREMLKWKTFTTIGIPLLVGSTIVSTPLAIISFFGLTWLLEKRQERIRRRKELKGEGGTGGDTAES